MSALERAETTLFVSSGMYASCVVLSVLVPAGGHIVATTDCYRRTRMFFKNELPKKGISVCYAPKWCYLDKPRGRGRPKTQTPTLSTIKKQMQEMDKHKRGRREPMKLSTIGSSPRMNATEMVDDAEKENRIFDRPKRVQFLIDSVDAAKEEIIMILLYSISALPSSRRSPTSPLQSPSPSRPATPEYSSRV